ncbi:transcription termination/antitermination protein NusA [Candidatus Parcubacteria bacterium]|nr:MAG: transcription termination/antitermination protein NusA [Candidatus Parcubacteria bacterium]
MAKTNNIAAAIKMICEEKNLSVDAVVGAIEAALAAAYRKEFGGKNQNIKVVFNADNAQTAVFDVKTVVEDVDLEEQEQQLEEQRLKREAGEEIPEEDLIKKFNPRTDIMISEAKELRDDYKIGDIIETKLDVPEEYGRMAAQTAKQVIVQRLREAERDHIFNEYKDKEGELVLGTIQRKEGRRYIVDMGKANGVLPPEEQIRGEGYNIGTRLNFYIVKVHMGNKGPEIVLSRTHPEIVRELFATEVPEIAAGTVEIKAISREAGSRSKIAVVATEENIDPVGSCVGQKGARVQTVINELGGEKVDIVEWDEDVKSFISNALSPANIIDIETNEEDQAASVKVEDDQLSLAIGKQGQNARLAAKLTGWKIDIISTSEDEKPTKDEESAPTKEKEEKTEKEDKEEKADKKKTKKEKEEDEEEVDDKEEKKEKKTTKKSKK